MDYKEEAYPKIPFYMTYPMQNMYLTEMEYEKDIERMKSYYPKEAQMVMKQVEDRLDELEYEGSRIYDEEPDRMMIQMEVDRLYQKIADEVSEKPVGKMYFDMVPMEIAGPGLAAAGQSGCRDSWLCSMVGVLFGNELYRRRCRHRRCRRWW
ncbi:MAG: hypothetical protein NC180_07760 [Muribaculaceae bacterium]|nr:hypothetical protein [Roseburia sp.]MCM1430172.1 hypothetical protein [Muribaculaceae bacterium]MCM1493102.1 hypothetical protein [Muribaculaceae bacterium]